MTEPLTNSGSPEIVALVIAAGSSKRLGRPKQLLAYRGATLLDATLDAVRSFGFARQIVTLGANATDIRDTVNLEGYDVVDSAEPTSGCSSSIVSALALVPSEALGIMLFLGDQPHIDHASVDALTAAGSAEQAAPIAVCRYADGIGHPFWFGRETFGQLATLHGDKAVWKVIESGAHRVDEVAIDGPIPLDVDTEADYERLLAAGPR